MPVQDDKDLLQEALLLQIRSLKSANAALLAELESLKSAKVAVQIEPPQPPAPIPAPTLLAPHASVLSPRQTPVKPASEAHKPSPVPVVAKTSKPAKPTVPEASEKPSHKPADAPKVSLPTKTPIINEKGQPRGPFADLRDFLATWESDSPAALDKLEALGRDRFPQIAKYAPITVQRHIREVLDARVKAGTLKGDHKGYVSAAKAEAASPLPITKPQDKPTKREVTIKPAAPAKRTPSLTPEQARDLEAKAKSWVEEYWTTHEKGTYSDIVTTGAAKLEVKVTSKWQEFVQVALKGLQAAGKINSEKGKGWSRIGAIA